MRHEGSISPIPLPCRCLDTANQLNIRCPRRAEHRRVETYPVWSGSIIWAAQRYHDHVLASGSSGLHPLVREAWEPIGTPAAADYRARTLARQAGAEAAEDQEPAGGRSGQPQRVGVIVAARPMTDEDTWPGSRPSARQVAGWELGTVVTHAKGIGSDVERDRCLSCGAIVRVKNDGGLYKHEVNEVSCGGEPAGEGVLVEIESVVVRGSGWVAYWTNGKPQCAYVHRIGKVPLSRLKSVLAGQKSSDSH